MTKNRNYGLDILRIWAMLGILGLHIVNKGGLLRGSGDMPVNEAFAKLLGAICYSSVDVFAMLTGYLCVNKTRNSTTRLVDLLATVAFYCVTIFAGFMIFSHSIFSGNIKLCVESIFPPITGGYWYVVCYALVFMLIPYLNTFIKALDEKRFATLIAILFVMLSIITTFGFYDYFKVGRGYSSFWLIFCYFVGAFIKLYGKKYFDLSKTKLLCITAVNVLVVWGFWFFGKGVVATFAYHLFQYTSPFMVVNAAASLLLFEKISLDGEKHRFLSKALPSLSSAAFSVYIIHTHPLVFYRIFSNMVIWAAESNIFVCIGVGISAIFAVYLVCYVIELVRVKIFKLLRINRLTEKLGSLLDRLVGWKEEAFQNKI